MQGYGSTHHGIFVQFMTMQEKHLRKEKGSWNLKRKLVVIMQLSKTLYNNNIVIIIILKRFNKCDSEWNFSKIHGYP